MSSRNFAPKHAAESTSTAPDHRKLRSRVSGAALAGCLALTMCPLTALAAQPGQDMQQTFQPAMQQSFDQQGMQWMNQPSDLQAPDMQGQMSNGQMPQGQAPQGEMPQGEAPDGELPAMPQGEMPDGELPEMPEGMAADMQQGQAPEGEAPEMPQGEMPQGAAPDMQQSAGISEFAENIAAQPFEMLENGGFSNGMMQPGGEAPNGSFDAPSDLPAPTQGEMPDGQMPQGEMPDGEATNGQAPALPDGEMPDGEAPALPDGEMPDGELPALPDGETPSDEAPALPNGEMPSGEAPDGAPQGEAPEAQADTPNFADQNGDAPDADKTGFNFNLSFLEQLINFLKSLFAA